jgi:hypothetical protein
MLNVGLFDSQQQKILAKFFFQPDSAPRRTSRNYMVIQPIFKNIDVKSLTKHKMH